MHHARLYLMGEKITLKPGQLITGRKVLSSELKIDENKVTRILKTFENEQQIEQQTSNKNRLITIVSWDVYQKGEQRNNQQVNNKRTTDEQQVNTNKNNKNIKDIKKYKEKQPKRNYQKINLIILSKEAMTWVNLNERC